MNLVETNAINHGHDVMVKENREQQAERAERDAGQQDGRHQPREGASLGAAAARASRGLAVWPSTVTSIVPAATR